MAYVGIGDIGRQLDLDADDLTVRPFDHEVHLMVTVGGAQVADPSLSNLGGNT